jgi:hypothetical protein
MDVEEKVNVAATLFITTRASHLLPTHPRVFSNGKRIGFIRPRQPSASTLD